MRLHYVATIAAASILTVGGTAFFSNTAYALDREGNVSAIVAENPCAGEKKENPCAGAGAENPCAGAENPCAGAENPCAGEKKENPCAGAENPCAGK